MLKTITEVSPQLVAFTLALKLSLSRPQQQHLHFRLVSDELAKVQKGNRKEFAAKT